MAKVSVGLIGCGSIGAFHAKRFDALDSAGLAAVCDINEGAMKALETMLTITAT